MLAVISNTQNSATLLSNQVFAPYGKPLSHNGNSLSQYTNKGFTGQYNDPTSGLDYYVSRYYDPVSGVFLSADKTLGDATGMNPYSYVGNNPETNNDPSGQAYIPPGGGGGGGSGGSGGTGGTGGGTGSGGGGAGYGGGGMGDPGSGGHEGGGCAWWNPSCDVQQIWHTIVNGAQTVEHDVETDVSDGMHFLQQQEQKIIEESWKLVVKIIVAIVAAAIAFGFFLYGALRNGPTDEQRAGRIQKKAHDAWQNQTPKRRNQSDYGGAYLVISGPNKKNQDYLSDPFIASGDPHVELQAIEWAKDMIAEYLKKYGSITSVNLLIYTYKYPCGTCASNLQDGTWQRQLQQAAGGNANVQIAVYYGLPVKQWLPSP